MNRRAALACLLLAGMPFGDARAQVPALKRLALFLRGTDPETALSQFRRQAGVGLPSLGWIEGKTLRLEVHLVDNAQESYPEAARQLVATRPDVIFTNTWFLARALRSATTTIPIVAVVGDPVGAGLAKSLDEPGGNITGISLATDVVGRKQLGLLKELMPRLTTIYGFRSSDPYPDLITAGGMERRSADSLGELEAMLARETPRQGTAAILVPPWIPGDAFKAMTDGYREVARLALGYRLPSMGGNYEFVDAGGLSCYSMGYRPEDRPRMSGRIDQMLRGGNPATTPFEMPTHPLFGINRGTASALGIKLPSGWIVGANHVV